MSPKYGAEASTGRRPVDVRISAWESRVLSGSSRAKTPLGSSTCCGLSDTKPSLLAAVPLQPSKGAEMSSIRETAEQFFDACETGKGWDGCQAYCHAGATFSSQAGALEGVDTLQGYTDWMKGLLTPVPDGRYEIRSFAVDDARKNVAAYGVFRGTHTGEGGPVPPTGKKVEADYVYVMDFDGDRIRHMTKIWNDGISLKQLGWM
jgi:predicted ester cyclase